MRDYGKISPLFWTGKTGKALRGDAPTQLVALYLMTCPTSEMTGVFTCPIVYIAHETGVGVEGATKALARLSELDFCTFEEDTDTVFVHEMAHYQIGSELKVTDNQVKGVRKAYLSMPEGHIRRGFYDRYRKSFHLVDLNEKQGEAQAPCKPLASQEQEQEQEQNKPIVPSQAGDTLPNPPATNARHDCPHQEIIALYHEVLPQCPQVRDWTPARATQLRARWNEDEKRQDLAYWKRFFEYVASCDFLVGRGHVAAGKVPFMADLEWLTKSANFTKIREEKYANRGAK